MAIAMRPSGTLTRKTERQPKVWVRNPPATGPKAEEAVTTAER